MNDAEMLRDYLEQRHPLMNALIVELGLTPRGANLALRLTVPRPGRDPVHFEALIPAAALEAEDEDKREFLLCNEVEQAVRAYEPLLAGFLRQEKRPLELVSTYEPARAIAPRSFEVGRKVNLDRYSGMVHGVDLDNGTVIVGADL